MSVGLCRLHLEDGRSLTWVGLDERVSFGLNWCEFEYFGPTSLKSPNCEPKTVLRATLLNTHAYHGPAAPYMNIFGLTELACKIPF